MHPPPLRTAFSPHYETYRWLHIGQLSSSFHFFFLSCHRFCFFFLFCLFYSLKFLHIGIIDTPLRDRQRQDLSGPDHIPENSHLQHHQNMIVITTVPLLLELAQLISWAICPLAQKVKSWGPGLFKLDGTSIILRTHYYTINNFFPPTLYLLLWLCLP